MIEIHIGRFKKETVRTSVIFLLQMMTDGGSDSAEQ